MKSSVKTTLTNEQFESALADIEKATLERDQFAGKRAGEAAYHDIAIDKTKAKLGINELCERAHANARAKGFYDNGEPNFDGRLMLIVSEVSEALEEWRNGHAPNEVYVANGKPEGVPVELADVVIRIADLCGFYGIDLEAVIEQKAQYNATRAHMHGGKRS